MKKNLVSIVSIISFIIIVLNFTVGVAALAVIDSFNLVHWALIMLISLIILVKGQGWKLKEML